MECSERYTEIEAHLHQCQSITNPILMLQEKGAVEKKEHLKQGILETFNSTSQSKISMSNVF